MAIIAFNRSHILCSGSRYGTREKGAPRDAKLLGVGGSLGKVGSFSPVLLPHAIGQVRYGRGRKGKRKCWKKSLETSIPRLPECDTLR